MKPNCWQFMKCGREIGSGRARKSGACPAASNLEMDGIHGGSCAGRACWVIAGTMCKSAPRGEYALKIGDCRKCEFYQHVLEEEGDRLISDTALLRLLKGIRGS